MMRILVAGADGTAAVGELGRRHEIIKAGRSTGDTRVDVTDEASIRAMFEKTGKVDAIVSTVGHTHFGPLATMTGEQFKSGLLDKLLGQVNLALIGQNYLNDGGSITLTSGVLDRDPVRQCGGRQRRTRSLCQVGGHRARTGTAHQCGKPRPSRRVGEEIRRLFPRARAGVVGPRRPRLRQECGRCDHRTGHLHRLILPINTARPGRGR
jgi:hypothetical protein